MRLIKRFTLLVILLLAITACSKDNKETINVYNAGEYIDTAILKDFEKEYNIKVNYNTYASNEDMYIKVTQGNDKYDVIFASDYMTEKLIKENFLDKINYNKIENYKNIEEIYRNMPFDPNNEYSVPYFVGTLGIIYNKSLINDDIDSWKDLWNKKYKNQIIMYNSQRDSIAIALKMLGYSMNSKDINELNQAKQALLKQKSLVYAYLTDDMKDAIVQGDAGIGVQYSGDAAMMISDNPDLKYVIPKEGSNIWMDSMLIPANAKNKAGAEKFINYLCRPEVAAKNAEYLMGYTSPVQGAKDYLPDEIKNSEVAFPDYSKLPSLETYSYLGEETLSLYDKIWVEVSASSK